MKQKDIALIIVIVFVSGIASFFLSRLLFVTPKAKTQKVEVVDSITTDFTVPSNKYFNSQSVDPTQQITIGGTNNSDPFQ